MILLIPTLIFQSEKVYSAKTNKEIHSQKIDISFLSPKHQKLYDYDFLKLDNCSYLTEPGAPILPLKSITIKLPKNSELIDVTVNIKEKKLEGNFSIIPCPSPINSNSQKEPIFQKNQTIYNSKTPFPSKSYYYTQKHGIDPETNKPIDILTVNIFPLRFVPNEKKILESEQVTISVTYSEISTTIKSEIENSELQNLIICSSTLETYADELAIWKNNTGIPSIVLNTTWIYNQYDGVDNQEKIRNCIIDFYTNKNISYVTIFGDADQVPVRSVYIPDAEAEETYIATDLYYADLDNSWDDDSDGLFAEQEDDTIDGIPDVNIGRIPASTEEYAQIAVDKIIGYKNNFDSEQNWTQNSLMVAGTGSGDGVDYTNEDGYWILKDYISENLDQNIIKLYDETGNLTTTDLITELEKGSLFTNFAGHGNPTIWLLKWKVPGILADTLSISNVQSLDNGFNLPVVVTDSCSTARFDDTYCIGESFLLAPHGGSIAYFGSTRISWGHINEFSPVGLMGQLDSKVYENYNSGQTRLGQMWSQSISQYVQEHIEDYQSAFNLDIKTIMEFILLGDPTTRIYNENYPQTINVPDNCPTIQYDFVLITQGRIRTLCVLDISQIPPMIGLAWCRVEDTRLKYLTPA